MTESSSINTIDLSVVGIGASAGGIQALKTFFEHVPTDSGMAYVVILHLSPDHDSQLAEILQHVASIPVTQVLERVHVEPNHVYVIPPNQHLMMLDGSLAVSRNLTVEERRAPVDIFFRTLAESHQSLAIAVVLSGTGANGSMGLKRIKENGGAVFVQSPREAEFNDMPRNAIATGMVDDVLPVGTIPDRIIAYHANLGIVTIPLESDQRLKEYQQALREVFAQLRLHTGHDFSNYKRPTLMRRIERRITVCNMPDLPSYAAFLRNNPNELQALLKDLLISVTNFFRDRKAFEALDHDVVLHILNSKQPEETVRVWVMGCATGEEAYSLAMLFAERTLGVIDAPKIQIFATDIDEAALMHAREGVYTLNDAADVPPEQLHRFFNKQGDTYRVRREIREMVLFAYHNILKDPPFSHLDLATCRNVMIYLNHTAQERVLETLHFALNPGGYLFLGLSESTDGASDLYAPVNREQHIYQSRQTGVRSYPVPESVPMLRLETPRALPSAYDQGNSALERITFGDLHQRLLEQYAPPSLVVNEEYDIVHLTERAGRYLQIAGGEPSNNLLKLIRPELRLELRTALYQALQRQTNVDANNLSIRIDDHTETINILVRPVLRENDTARGFIMVLFEQSANTTSDAETVFLSEEPVARQLEEELLRVKMQLRTTNEQHEFQAEELKASNEELQAINEELRSAADELETSKEEMQSINEELRTVNQELKIKIEETTLANNNLLNLVNSTEIGTIFLDRSFRVALFTPAAREIFNLISADHGRPLSDITHRMIDTDVLADAELVLNKLQSIEREVRTTDERVWTMRTLPYRTAEDRINGVVITFFNITNIKRADQNLLESEARFRTLSDTVPQIIWTNEADGKVNYLNQRWYSYSGLNYDQSVGLGWEAIVHPDDAPASTERWQHALATSTQFDTEYRLRGADGVYRWFIGRSVPLHDNENRVIGWFGSATDIHDLKQAEAGLRESEARLRAIVGQATAGVAEMDVTGMFTLVNQRFCELTRYSEAELLKMRVFDITHPDDLAQCTYLIKMAVENGTPFTHEKRYVRSDGTYMWVNDSVSVTFDSKGKTQSVIAVVIDITQRKEAESDLQRAKEELEQRVQERTAALSTTNDALQQEILERTQVEAQRALLLQRIITAQEDERQRIARELHDSLGQFLSALNLRLALAQEGKDLPMPVNQELAQLRTLANQIDDEVDRLTMELRPPTLSDMGLVDALVSYTHEWTATSGIPVDIVTLNFDTMRFPAVVEAAVYRIVQEALNNVLEHAQASQVSIVLEQRSALLHIVIEDNGKGFDHSTRTNGGTGGRQIGLTSMTERATLVGGELTIESALGTGTTVYLRVPLVSLEETSHADD